MTTWEKGGRMSLPPIFHHFILKSDKKGMPLNYLLHSWVGLYQDYNTTTTDSSHRCCLSLQLFPFL